MTEKSYSKFERAERVDQPDLQHAAEQSHRNALTQLIEEVVLGADGSPVELYGWDASYVGSVLTVIRGSAITGFRDRGVLYRAAILSGGPTSRTRNVASYADGSYGVYVRLALRPGEIKNRRIWDASSATEVTRLISTRTIEDWDLVVERGNPGEDYLQIATVTITGGSLSGYTHIGSRLFDSSRSNRAYEDADWGAAADRDETDTIGIRGLARWTKMVGRQLQDIIDVDFFGNDPKGGDANGNGPRSLSQLNSEKLARNGAQAFQGVFSPDAGNTRDQGSTGARWRQIYAMIVDAASYFISAGNEDGFRYSATRTFYAWQSVGDAHWDQSLGASCRVSLLDPFANTNPNKIEIGVGAALAADTYVFFPINLPQGSMITNVRFYFDNNNVVASTGLAVFVDTVLAGPLSLSSTYPGPTYQDPGAVAVAGVPGGRGRNYVDFVCDSGNVIDNATGRYYAVLQALAARTNVVSGIRITYTSDRVRPQG